MTDEAKKAGGKPKEVDTLPEKIETFKAKAKDVKQKEEEQRVLSIFERLSSVACETEEKEWLTYISWADAWNELLKIYPEASYHWHENEHGTLWFIDDFGWYAKVSVTINDITKTAWLPIMSNRNDAMKREPSVYTKYDKYKKMNIDITVPAIDSMAINKAYQRAFAKAISMHGLGLYVYRGEDLPTDISDVATPAKKSGWSAEPQAPKITDEEVIEAYKRKVEESLKAKELDMDKLKEITKGIWSDYNIQKDTPLFTSATNFFNESKKTVENLEEFKKWTVQWEPKEAIKETPAEVAPVKEDPIVETVVPETTESIVDSVSKPEPTKEEPTTPVEATKDDKENEVIVFETWINDLGVKWELTIDKLKELTKSFWIQHKVMPDTPLFSQATDVFNKYKTALESKK